MPSTQAVSMRLHCDAVQRREDCDPVAEDITLSAVTSGGDDDPNKSYAMYTPSANLTAWINNEAVHGFFEPGVEYDVTIRRKE